MTDEFEKFEDDVHDIWTGPAEFGYLVGPEDLEGVPIEGLMLMREDYDEQPADPVARAVAALLDMGIMMAFNAIGLTPGPEGSYYIAHPASRQKSRAGYRPSWPSSAVGWRGHWPVARSRRHQPKIYGGRCCAQPTADSRWRGDAIHLRRPPGHRSFAHSRRAAVDHR